jgi:hypothetical protein
VRLNDCRFKWSMTLPLWHIDAVADGGVHPIAVGFFVLQSAFGRRNQAV